MYTSASQHRVVICPGDMLRAEMVPAERETDTQGLQPYCQTSVEDSPKNFPLIPTFRNT